MNFFHYFLILSFYKDFSLNLIKIIKIPLLKKHIYNFKDSSVGTLANSVKFWQLLKSIQFFFSFLKIINEEYFENFDTPLLGFNGIILTHDWN